MTKCESPVVIFTIIYSCLQRCPSTLSFNVVLQRCPSYKASTSLVCISMILVLTFQCDEAATNIAMILQSHKEWVVTVSRTKRDAYMWTCIGEDHRFVTLVIRNILSSNALFLADYNVSRSIGENPIFTSVVDLVVQGLSSFCHGSDPAVWKVWQSSLHNTTSAGAYSVLTCSRSNIAWAEAGLGRNGTIHSHDNTDWSFHAPIIEWSLSHSGQSHPWGVCRLASVAP
jgi:hypothetical protein